MSVELLSVTRRITADESADPSYLEQDGFDDRLRAFRNDEFGFVGIQAVAEIRIPHGESWISQEIASPGIWGVEDDAGEEYFEEAYEEELGTLTDMLRELGITTVSEAVTSRAH